MLLDTASRSLQFLLDGASALVMAVAHYEDTDSQGRLFPGTKVAVSAGTGVVTLVPVPGNNTARRIKEISFANTDATTKIVTVQLKDGATVYTIITTSVPTKQTLYYNSEFGWSLVA